MKWIRHNDHGFDACGQHRVLGTSLTNADILANSGRFLIETFGWLQDKRLVRNLEHRRSEPICDKRYPKELG